MTKRFLPSLFALALCAVALPARAATIEVSTTASSGAGSLRAAIETANNQTTNPGSDTITFNSGVFATPQVIGSGFTIDISSDVIIQGPAAGVTLNGSISNNILNVSSSAKVAIDNLTLINGQYAVENYGEVNVTNSFFAGNNLGIVNYGTLSVASSNFNENSSAIASSLKATVEGCGFRRNYFVGIFNSGQMTVTKCTLDGSDTYGFGNTGTATITNSTIANNRHGLYITNGVVTVTSSTLSFNYNTGINNLGGTANLKNTLVVGNPANISGSFIDNGGNRTAGTVADAGLDPEGLKENGGPTKTIALLAGSPAIDAGVAAEAPNTDQRGEARPKGAGVDIGAFESTPQNLVGFVVTTTEDTADGDLSANDISLREAINSANADPDENTITFDPQVFSTPQTITVGSALPSLTADATIQGPNAALTINGVDDSFFVFTVGAAVKAGFSRLTMTNGINAINVSGDATVANCTISGTNTGINTTFNGRLTITNSTLNDNGVGIGVSPGSSSATITNCTLSNNTYAGITCFSNPVVVSSSTIAGNARGIQILSGAVTLKNNLIVGNTTDNISGNTSDHLVDEGGNRTTGTASEAGLDPEGLKNNGGPTRTIALLPGSPAINAGTSSGATATDQRGVSRPQGAGVDIGAFEYLGALEAGGLVVTLTNDEDDGNYAANDISLREAVKYANAFDDDSTITFDPTIFATPQVIETGSSLFLTENATIQGPASGVAIDGSNTFNIFNVAGGAQVSFKKLSILNGSYGIENWGDTNVTDCTLSGNQYGITNFGKLALTTSTVTQCPVGIHNGGTATVTSSTFDTCFNLGINVVGSTSVVNSTFAGNGTAVFVVSNAVTITNSTITANNYGISGPGNGTLPKLKNSLVVGNSTANVAGSFTNDGGNRTTGTAADAKLDFSGLNDNGGPTRTIALLAGSPAIDAGVAGGAPNTDQRGETRPQGAGVDIGAFERDPQSVTGYVVTVIEDTNDGDYSAGDISLREAILTANIDPDKNIITFDPQVFATLQTITLGSFLPALAQDVEIQGPAAGVTLDGVNKTFSLIGVNSGVTASFSKLTLTNGQPGLANLGTATVIDCTFSNNAQGITSNGALTLKNSTLDGNTYGVQNQNTGTVGQATITNCTFTGHSAAIVNGNRATIVNNTLTGNTYGVYTLGSGQTELKNCIVVDNGTAATFGTFTNSGGNTLTGTAAAAGLDPDGLKDNGGPTKTIALVTGSSAVDTGVPSGAPNTDQRGVSRPQGEGVDRGAFELGPNTGDNIPPVVADINISTEMNQTYTFSQTSFDGGFTDEDEGDVLTTVKITSLPASGRLKLGTSDILEGQAIARGHLEFVSYVPAAGFTGITSFGYNASDGTAFAAEAARVNISVDLPNEGPDAVDDRAEVDEDSVDNVIDVLENDTDPEDNTLTITAIPHQGDKGTVAIINDGAGLTYTPNAGETGEDAFTYTISDGKASDTAVVTITIMSTVVNAAPVATDTSVSTPEDTPLDIELADLVSDDNTADGNLVYTLVDEPAASEGTIELNDGVVTFTPADNFGGETFFTYYATDEAGLDSEIKKVTINVNSENDAPVLDEIGDMNATEGVLLTFTATADDAEDNILTFSLENEPEGATITTDGDFSWTPSEGQDGPSTFTVRVSDGDKSAEEEITVTVGETNTAPVLDEIGGKSATVNVELTFTATATDTDIPAQALTFSLDDAPEGTSISEGGAFTWTPTGAQGGKTYTFTIRVSDGDKSDEEEITVTVAGANAAPVLSAVGNKSVNEGALLSFAATATDSDLPAQTLTFSLVDAPEGASITEGGAFTWTPSEAQGPGSYTFKVKVSDGEKFDEKPLTVSVAEVNASPAFKPTGNYYVAEGSNLTFTVVAEDSDLPAQTITYSCIDLPEGATVDSVTGVFSWTPTEAQGGQTYTLNFRAGDGVGQPGGAGTAIRVGKDNTAPVLAAIGNKTVTEGSLLGFTATATDSDVPVQDLTFSLLNAPDGATITAGGNFTWTPTLTQGPATYSFTVRVTDGGKSDTEVITVNVLDFNTAPNLAAIPNKSVNEGAQLSFAATATDSNLPAQTLTFSLVDAPSGANITSAGAFTWTPTEAQGPGSYTFKVRVSDGVLFDEKQLTVTVAEVNSWPLLKGTGNFNVNEGRNLTFTLVGTDSDLPAQTLRYSCLDLPEGATVDAVTGVFSWTPTEAQGGKYYVLNFLVSDEYGPGGGAGTSIRVDKVNSAPVLAAIGDKNVDAGALLAFTASAIDSDLPVQTLTFALESQPIGAVIDSRTGAFSWTPTPAQAGQSYAFIVKVSDGETRDYETITVNVAGTNLAPVLPTIGSRILKYGSTATFNFAATDADLPKQILTYSLVGAPTGASINPTTGVFTWTPTAAQSNNNFYSFKVRVVDDGTPSLSDEETADFTVQRPNTNTAPVLPFVGSRTIFLGATANFNYAATDSDIPKDTLTYSLVGAPAGATINPSTGAFTWTPTAGQAVSPNNFYSFKVKVTDDGFPAKSDEETASFTVAFPVDIGVNTTNPSLKANNASQSVTFTYTVRNNNNVAYSNLKVQGDVFWPTTLSGLVLTPASGTTATQSNLTTSSKRVTWTIPSLPAGSSKTISVKLTGVVPTNAPVKSKIASGWILSSVTTGVIPSMSSPEVFLNTYK